MSAYTLLGPPRLSIRLTHLTNRGSENRLGFFLDSWVFGGIVLVSLDLVGGGFKPIP